MLLIASFSANDITQLKRNNNQMQGLFKETNPNCGKMRENLATFLKTNSKLDQLNIFKDQNNLRSRD